MMMKRDNGEGFKDPRSQVTGLKVTEKSTTHIRWKRVNSQQRRKGHNAWRIEPKKATDYGQWTKELAGQKQQDTSYRSPPQGDGQKSADGRQY